MATKAELQEQVDTLLELNSVQVKALATARDLISELNRQLGELRRNTDAAVALESDELSAQMQAEDDTLPWDDAPIVYTRKPAQTSYKARCEAARKEAMASGKVVRI